MDYATDIKPLEDIGKTDEQIAEILQAVTPSEISVELAAEYFRDNDLWLRSPIGYSGSLQVAYLDAVALDTKVVLKGLDILWRAAFDRTDEIHTRLTYRRNGNAKGTQPALQIKKCWDKMLQKDQVGQSDIDGFYGLDGGLAYPNATTQDVADTRAAFLVAETDRLVIEQLQLDWVAALNDGGINSALAIGDRDAMVVALRAAADSLEV